MLHLRCIANVRSGLRPTNRQRAERCDGVTGTQRAMTSRPSCSPWCWSVFALSLRYGFRFSVSRPASAPIGIANPCPKAIRCAPRGCLAEGRGKGTSHLDCLWFIFDIAGAHYRSRGSIRPSFASSLQFLATLVKPRGRREDRVLTSHPRSAARKV